MSVFLLTWNPSVWIIEPEDWIFNVALTAGGGSYEEPWSTGNRTKGIRAGDRVLLVRVGKDRGIVASGRAISVVYKDLHFNEKRAKKKDLANYVMVNWDIQVEIEKRLPIEVLLREFPEVPWNNLYGSGVRVVDNVADKLTARWYRHVKIEKISFPDEPTTYPEGALTPVLVNRYERNPRARRDCLDHYGAKCSVCGFEGRSTYGQAGDGLIHVHHVVENSKVGPDYKVDPIKDLVPVCPNCHAMIHRREKAYSVTEVKKLLRQTSRKRKGVTQIT